MWSGLIKPTWPFSFILSLEPAPVPKKEAASAESESKSAKFFEKADSMKLEAAAEVAKDYSPAKKASIIASSSVSVRAVIETMFLNS